MKQIFWIIGGLCAAAAGFLVLQRRGESVSSLAHQLDAGWATEHHTVV